MFMQSPAGWMCIILVVIASVAAPLMERKLKAYTNVRLMHLGLLPAPEADPREDKQ